MWPLCVASAPCKAFAQSLPSALRGARAVGRKAGSRSVFLQPVLNWSQRGQQQARADTFALGLFAGGASDLSETPGCSSGTGLSERLRGLCFKGIATLFSSWRALWPGPVPWLPVFPPTPSASLCSLAPSSARATGLLLWLIPGMWGKGCEIGRRSLAPQRKGSLAKRSCEAKF